MASFNRSITINDSTINGNVNVADQITATPTHYNGPTDIRSYHNNEGGSITDRMEPQYEYNRRNVTPSHPNASTSAATASPNSNNNSYRRIASESNDDHQDDRTGVYPVQTGQVMPSFLPTYSSVAESPSPMSPTMSSGSTPSSRDMISIISEATNEPPNFLYDMTNGFVQIINNIQFADSQRFLTRYGSEEDETSLVNFFEGEASWVDVYKMRNKTAPEIKEKISDLSKRDFRNYQAFIFIILTHGSEEGVYGVDGGVVRIEQDILSQFGGDNCPSLRDKPKIFIIQACRGDMTDEGCLVRAEDSICTRASIYSYIPKFSEYLVLYPSSPGFTATRHENQGTYYIQALVQIFKDFYRHEHLVEMLLRVNYKMALKDANYVKRDGKVSTIKSMPCMDVRLKRKYYFHSAIVNIHNALKERMQQPNPPTGKMQ